jgi:hypothetical protein
LLNILWILFACTFSSSMPMILSLVFWQSWGVLANASHRSWVLTTSTSVFPLISISSSSFEILSLLILVC